MLDNWKKYRSQTYPKFWKEQVKVYGFQKYYKLVLDSLDVKRGEKILDCGVGTGEFRTLYLAKKGAEMYGIDIARSLLDECKKTFQKENLGIKVVYGDIESMPVKDNSFDKVISFGTMWYLPNFEKGLKEMFRVTKEGGLVVFEVLNLYHKTIIAAYLKTIINYKILNKKEIQYWKPITPIRVSNILKKLHTEYDLKGFFVFIREKANLCKYSNLFSHGLSDSPFRYFGSKLVYICRKGN